MNTALYKTQDGKVGIGEPPAGAEPILTADTEEDRRIIAQIAFNVLNRQNETQVTPDWDPNQPLPTRVSQVRDHRPLPQYPLEHLLEDALNR